MEHNIDTIAGTAGGTLLTIVSLPSNTAIISTIILALIGAVTSFFVSLACKKIYEKYFKKKIEEPKFKSTFKKPK